MKNEQQTWQDLIDYILDNSKSYSKKDLENRSMTTLTILKTEIEINLYHARQAKTKGK